MSHKRKQSTLHPDTNDSKRLRASAFLTIEDEEAERRSVKPELAPRVDPTYGQRGAFPGLDDEDLDSEDELFYGPADDGLAYLRMVR
jgi:hypothetical protein